MPREPSNTDVETFAWTAPDTQYPAFINISKVPEGIRVIMREKAHVPEIGMIECGELSLIVIPNDMASKLLLSLLYMQPAPLDKAHPVALYFTSQEMAHKAIDMMVSSLAAPAIIK